MNKCPICGANDSKAMVMDATFFACGSKWSTRGQCFIKIKCHLNLDIEHNIVKVETVEKVIEYLDKINSLKFEDIVFVDNGRKICIPEHIVDDFRFSGLNNTDFIKGGLCKEMPKI